MTNQKSFRSYIIEKSIIGNGIINGIVNAIIFYFLERGHLDEIFYPQDIIIDIALTTFLLGIILVPIVMPMTVKDCKNNKFKFSDEGKKIASLLPNKRFGLYLTVGAICCVITTIIAALAATVFGISPLTVMQMMVFKGVMCAIAGAIAGYLTVIKTIDLDKNDDSQIAA